MNDGTVCKTRYPILMVHGIAYRDDLPLLKYWGRIPGLLRRSGAEVFFGNSESWGSYEKNAELLCGRIGDIVGKTKCDRVNIIAHSKGGIDSRFMITVLDTRRQVASLTTISTPHRGSYIADVIVNKLLNDKKIYGKLLDLYGRIIGDKDPEGGKVVRQLTTAHMKGFNEAVPDSKDVYYASYGSDLKKGLNDPLFYFSYNILYEKEGVNDGLVSVTSSRWGEYKGTFTGKKRKGISHLDIIDFKRIKTGGIDIPSLYREIVKDLKEKGY
ncbi:MAG: hypothetical protein JW881_11295 [Spirochaetales bacterium]|nr:hypothetical protein [Spirochaetales bacterium]